MNDVAFLDSLSKANVLVIGAAHPETITVAVHDTVVRVAAAALGGQAELWRISAQILAAALAVAGGALVQKHFKNRDERRERMATARAENAIRNQLAIGVSSICGRLSPVIDKIVSNKGVFASEIEEVTRRVRAFEALIPLVHQLRDKAHATQVYLWFSLAEWLPEDLDLLVGNMTPYRNHAEPEPLEPALAAAKASLLAFRKGIDAEEGGPQDERQPQTRGDVALQRIKRVLAEGRILEPVIEIYDPGGDGALVPILASHAREVPPTGSTQ